MFDKWAKFFIYVSSAISIALIFLHPPYDKLIMVLNVGIPLKLIRRSAATWKCVPPLIDQGVPGGLTRYSGAI